MGAIRGTDFMFNVSIGSTMQVLCRATDFILNTATRELETTGPNNGKWDSFIPAGNNYTLSVPAVASYTDPMNIVQLQETQNANMVIPWLSGISQTGGVQYSGSMFITNITMTSQFRDVVRFDLAARGTGNLLITKLPISKSVYLSDTKGVRLAGCPNPYPVGVLWYDGTFIGMASSAEDVKAIFNEYASTQGDYLEVTGYTGGCDFTMQIAWNSPINPTFIPAVPGDGFVIGTGFPGGVIGESDLNQNVIGV